MPPTTVSTTAFNKASGGDDENEKEKEGVEAVLPAMAFLKPEGVPERQRGAK